MCENKAERKFHSNPVNVTQHVKYTEENQSCKCMWRSVIHRDRIY